MKENSNDNNNNSRISTPTDDIATTLTDDGDDDDDNRRKGTRNEKWNLFEFFFATICYFHFLYFALYFPLSLSLPLSHSIAIFVLHFFCNITLASVVTDHLLLRFGIYFT